LPSARNRHRFEPFEWRQQTPEMSIRSMSCHRQICSTRRSNSGDKATGTFAAAKRSPRDYTEVYISLECTTTSLAHGRRICSHIRYTPCDALHISAGDCHACRRVGLMVCSKSLDQNAAAWARCDGRDSRETGLVAS
jgi:hypothetical protein